MPLLPVEAKLFLLAIKPHDDRDDATIAELAASPIRWGLLTHLAERERLLSVMWHRLRAFRTSATSEWIERLQRRTMVIDFQMAATQRVLSNLVARLAADDIPSLLLKGAALGSTVYQSFAARPMCDLDVLVPDDRAQDAWSLLHDSGWVREVATTAFHDDFHHMPPLVAPGGGGIILELHRCLMPRPGPFRLDNAAVWRDSESVTIGATGAYVPSDVHQLLHLCVHFAWGHSLDHGIGRVVRDVATLVDARPIDWQALVAIALKSRAGTCVYWTLRIANRLADVPVPADVFTALAPRLSRSTMRMLERAYIASAVIALCPSVRLGQMLWTVGMQPSRSGHGKLRPWHSTEEFREAFHIERMPLGARLHAHLKGLGAWVRFAHRIAPLGERAM